jgi:hypothetical protein
MLTRRDLFLSGAFASSLRPAAQTSSSSDSAAIAKVLTDIRDTLQSFKHAGFTQDMTEIRQRQQAHFKINQKLPDFIDVGLLVWERLYDWHLDNKVPLKVTRVGDRFEMEMMLITVVLRHDIADNQIGLPYDR